MNLQIIFAELVHQIMLNVMDISTFLLFNKLVIVFPFMETVFEMIHEVRVVSIMNRVTRGAQVGHKGLVHLNRNEC